MVVHIARLRWRKVPIFAKFVGGGGRLQLLARSAPFASRWQTDGGRPGLSQSFELRRVGRPSSASARALIGWPRSQFRKDSRALCGGIWKISKKSQAGHGRGIPPYDKERQGWSTLPSRDPRPLFGVTWSWNALAQSSRQSNLVVLFVDQDLANLFAQSIFSQLLALTDALAIIANGFRLVFEVEL